MRILIVFGTRPEAIKIYPIIKEALKLKSKIKTFVCVTAQHRQMLDPYLKYFKIKVDFDLNLMQKAQSLDYLTTQVLTKVGAVIDKVKPDYVLVQGDTTTSMASALAAYYRKVKVVHVEAGLRTYDNQNPFPEEFNRCVIDQLSDLFFVHSSIAKQNLIKEGRNPINIFNVGNTVIDSLLEVANLCKSNEDSTRRNYRKILVTAHRRENHGKPLIEICNALKEIAHKYSDNIKIVFPVHLNPKVNQTVYSILGRISNIQLMNPVDYFDFVQLMKESDLILSDSGGIQEEAPSLNKPVLVLRTTTERPEALKAGATKLIGTNKQAIINEVITVLENPNIYRRMAKAKNPYGDGKAAKKIIAQLIKK